MITRNHRQQIEAECQRILDSAWRHWEEDHPEIPMKMREAIRAKVEPRQRKRIEDMLTYSVGISRQDIQALQSGK
jgi:hypothetical protein